MRKNLGSWRAQKYRGNDEIEFCQRSKKYRTKYFAALKQLFATEGEANESEVDKGVQVNGTDTNREV
jgi:hypothetical protein